MSKILAIFLTLSFLLSPYQASAATSTQGFIDGYVQENTTITGWAYDPTTPPVISLRVQDLKTKQIYNFRSGPSDAAYTRDDVTNYLSQRLALNPANPPKGFAISVENLLPAGNFRILGGSVNDVKLKMTPASMRAFRISESKPRLLFFDQSKNTLTGWVYSSGEPVTLTLTLQNLTDSSLTYTLTLTPNSSRPDVSKFLKNRYGLIGNIPATGFSQDLLTAQIPDGQYRITSARINSYTYPNPDLLPTITIKGSGVPTTPKIQVCPDAWFINKMPSTYPNNSTQENEYLIVNGKKASIKDYDLGWIRAKCAVNQPSPVY